MEASTPTPGRHRVLISQAAAIVLAGVVFWISGGARAAFLDLSPDIFFWILAAGHPLLLVLLIARNRRLFSAPHSLIPWLLLPAAVAWLGAALSLGAAPETAEAASRCDLFLLAGAVSERLRFLGLLSTAALCLGAAFFLEPETSAAPSSGVGRALPALLGVPTAALAAWALLEPGLPRGVPIMDRSVFALWPIPALVAALWPVGRILREHLAGRCAPRAAARALLALLAVLAGTLAVLSMDRARALAEGLFAASRLGSLPEMVIVPEAAVLSAVAARLLPWTGVLLLAVFGLALWREKAGRRPLALAAGIVLALSVLGVGFEAQYQKGREERCASVQIAVEKKVFFRRMPRLCTRRSGSIANSQRRKFA